MQKRTMVASLIAVWLLATVSAFAGDTTKAKGMIISRTGETLIVSGADGKTTVVLDDSTKVQKPKGIFRHKEMSAAVLIPGLKVEVDGTTDAQGRLTAKTIRFDANDLETAEMIQAGLHPTAVDVAANQQAIATNTKNIAANKQDIAANQVETAANKQAIAANSADIQKNVDDIESNTKRFTELSEYDVKGDLTVNFKVGSSKVSADDMAKIKQLAQSATGLTGYIVEVKGYTDSTGGAAMNTTLSQDRAQSVINVLVQQGGIPVRHIVAPGAYGETHQVASNETAAGRADNRRVEVKILVNKGIAGS
jgi:outer membrane protein OmpA-like peptidoglycan-associated protein